MNLTDQLKDTKLHNTQRYIRNALGEDFIPIERKEQLVTAYNELTEENANKTMNSVKELVQVYYDQQAEQRKLDNKALKKNWFWIFMTLYLCFVFNIFFIDPYLPSQYFPGSFNEKMIISGFTGLVCAMYSIIPTLAEYY